MEMVAEYLTDLAIADCLATMRARMCVKRHGDVALDRYFKGVGRVAAEVGVPQGGAISMLIANWVLDIADRRVERWGDESLFYARFCDDIVIAHPDRRKCRAARDRYLRALERLLLP